MKDDKTARSLHTNSFLILTFTLILFSGGILTYQFFVDPDIPFVLTDSKASWISAPINVEVAITKPQKHVFLYQFETYKNKNIFLHVKALQAFTIWVNDKMLSQTSNKNWKKTTSFDISSMMTKGVNHLAIEVESWRGPALLYAYMTGLEKNISTDSNWVVTDGTTLPEKAVVADDIQNPYREAAIKMQPKRQVLLKKIALLAILFMVSGFLFLGIKLLSFKLKPSIPLLLFVAINLIWLFLFLRFTKLPTGVGFDAEGHLSYIAYLLQNHRLPLANEGWEMFQPPLFYVLSAGIIKVFNHIILTQNVLLRIVPAVSCLGNIWVTYYVARKLFQNSTSKIVFMTALAGFVPMNIYIASYISNESLNSFLTVLLVGAATLILLQEKTSWSQIIFLGIVSGLALLTKYTAITIFSVVVLFLAVKFFAYERLSFLKSVSKLFVYCFITFGLSGWHYLRNMKHFGRLFVLNLDFSSQWLFPGFHTPKYYLQFGEVFRNPFFAGYYSFWDGLYSTFWGDGLMGATPSTPFWNYDDMTVGYLLSVPASIILIFGMISMSLKSFTEPSSSKKICFSFFSSLLFTFICSMLYYSVKGPSITAVKAFFGIHLIIPICVSFGLGIDVINHFLNRTKLLPLQFGFYGWFGTFLWFLIAPYLN